MKREWQMRCAAGCGVVVRGGGSQAKLGALAVSKGMVKIGKLYYCARCAKKRKGGDAG